MAKRQTTSENYAFLPPSPSAMQPYDWLFQTPVDLHNQLGQPTPRLAITGFGQPYLRLATAYPSALDNHHH